MRLLVVASITDCCYHRSIANVVARPHGIKINLFNHNRISGVDSTLQVYKGVDRIILVNYSGFLRSLSLLSCSMHFSI